MEPKENLKNYFADTSWKDVPSIDVLLVIHLISLETVALKGEYVEKFRLRFFSLNNFSWPYRLAKKGF